MGNRGALVSPPCQNVMKGLALELYKSFFYRQLLASLPPPSQFNLCSSVPFNSVLTTLQTQLGQGGLIGETL